MLYPHQLRVRIQDRKNRLYRSDGEAYLSELRYFLEFLHGNHFTRALLAMIDSDASVDFGQWVADVEQKRILYFPDTEVGRAKICYGFLKEGAGAGSFRGLLSLEGSSTEV